MLTKLQITFKCENCDERRHVSELALCSWCDGGKAYYCIKHCSSEECQHAVDCTLPGHASCWDSESHAKPSKRRQHVPRDAVAAWCIEQIMYSESNEVRQQQHHISDREALWFSVNHAGWTSPRGPEPCLQVSQRFEKLWQSQANLLQGTQKFPSFVSFVGPTGVGKSTLVRAMMMTGAVEDMRHQQLASRTSDHWLNERRVWECRTRGPVTRANHATLQMKPTSEGVHLYQDSTIQRVRYDEQGRDAENVTILLADCEGFNADTTLTSAARTQLNNALTPPRGMRRSDSVSSQSTFRASSVEPPEANEVRANLRYHRIIPIEAPHLRKRGRDGAELFYARYLYAFSDVVTFVTDKLQSLGSELRKFLEWIARAEKSALPPRSPRTLIVVINKADTHSDQYYSESFLKDQMFNDLANQRIWESSEELQSLKDKHDKPILSRVGRITDNMMFFRLFFQDVRICYIPQRGKDPEQGDQRLYAQYQVLRHMIVKGSKEGQAARSSSYSRYDVPQVAHLLDKAFDHYATSDEPFDFHAAARRDNPTPISLAGHISNLLRHTKTDPRDFDRIADLLAVNLLTHEFRETDQGK